MKTIRLIILLLIAAALLVQADSNDVVSSVNIVGYVQKDLVPGQYLLAGVNFTASDEEPTLKDVVGTNQLTAAANYSLADRVGLWDRDNVRYQYYATYTDGEFYPCNDINEWLDAIVAGTSTNPTIMVGAGFWIIPAGGAVTTNEIHLSGDVIKVATNTVDLLTGYQMVSYPFSCDQNIDEINTSDLVANANYSLADRIVVWESDHYQYYGLYTDGSWYACNDLTEWVNAITGGVAAVRNIELGEGFWFIAQNDTSSLVETNKYLSEIE